MQLELELPDETVRKLRALNILLGGTASVEELLAKMLDEAIVSKIVDTITAGQPRPVQTLGYIAPLAQPRVAEGSVFHDLTGVSDGLGDPEPPPAPKRKAARRPATPPPALVADASDEALEHDMDVTDPDHEAKVEAPTFADQMGQGQLAPSAEEAFGLASGTPPPAPDIKPRAGRAKINPKRVSAFTGGESDRI